MKTQMRNTAKFIRTNQRILAATLLMASFASCQKGVIEPAAPAYDESAMNAKVSAKATGNLVWSDNLEGSTFFSTVPSVQTATSYAITTVTNPVYQGSKAARFELRDTDPENHSGTRSEISFDDPTNLNRWYSYALYVPSAYYKADAEDEIITQWHQGGSLTPALCLRVKSDKLYIRILGTTWVELGNWDKDAWHAYVMHVKHSSGSDGLIEIWKDGVKIMNRSGANMYKVEGDLHNPSVKMGIYKSDWNGSGTTATNIRVIYMDDIKIGNENATYADMVPTKNGTTTTTTPPTTTTPTTTTPIPVTTSGVTDFKLVNSETEKDVVSITNGATISLSKYDLSKANIRAVVTSDVKSVKFELSGKQSKTSTDDAAPFALHGDDGDGNFFYGNWAPPALGTYTLKVTPNVGAVKTITFTIAK
ncbi:polysaccharide lyase [Niastella sp. OAS944]|uniref:polysaccharide lyase n=1 Tax=Niastella sp. OAS944 TaxID=2664089 RepID=UPI00348ED167|nr:hypothetical protein [Chitinophagaceae bacterium OAS944]